MSNPKDISPDERAFLAQIGANIRRRRRELELSQEAVGAHLGYSVKSKGAALFSHRVEKTFTHRISLFQLMLLCDLMKVPMAYFFQGTRLQLDDSTELAQENSRLRVKLESLERQLALLENPNGTP